jgi:SpoVK/Ycf46/Vps4 family AAA+-type ATPase
MSNIKLVEDITTAFIDGNTSEVVNILKKESRESKHKKNLVVSKRLDNLLKKIPYNSFSAASVNDNLAENDVYRKKIFINNPNLISEYRSSIIPEQVVLDVDIKNLVSTFFREWEGVESLLKFGLHPTNKILLYGPPGTGKTLLAHAIANQLNFPLVLVRLDELISSYLGKTGQNIREIFDIAKQKNVVLFLDEIDTVAKHRADEKELGELKRIVTVLLQNIDFFPHNSVIIGATNHEDILDKAIWRRFPLKIKLELPNTKSRELMFTLFLEKIDKNVDLNLLVRITEGLSGSEIFDLTQQATKNFVISGKERLTTVEVLIAYFQLMLGRRLIKEGAKQNLYKMCQTLKDAGYALKDIKSIANIPYTTLRDNIK